MTARSLVRMAGFALAGGVGFVVDATILTLLVDGAGWSPLSARLPSFLLAVSVTWLINRHFAFADRRARLVRAMAGEFWRYLLIQGSGAVLNFGIFAALLWLVPAWNALPAIALAIASACAMVFNYAVLQGFVFRPRAAAADRAAGLRRYWSSPSGTDRPAA
ncbi:MAG TPA: GtrA family protein [Steroidobacteraceae bacterium]|nr:GtrA family protein [Steroidobacteraceae bacterium]